MEMAYDTIDRHGMWQILRVYGVGGKNSAEFLYSLVGNDVSE